MNRSIALVLISAFVGSQLLGCAAASGDESSSESESAVSNAPTNTVAKNNLAGLPGPAAEPNPIPWRTTGLTNANIVVTEPNPIPWTPNPGPSDDPGSDPNSK